MASQRALNIFNIISIICGVWYLAFGWFWVWFINVLMVFPFAVVGFFLWWAGRKGEKKILNRVAGWLLVAGTVTSFGMLTFWIISDKF